MTDWLRAWGDMLLAGAAAVIAGMSLWLSARSAGHAKDEAKRSADSAERAASALEQQAELMRLTHREPTVAWKLNRPHEDRSRTWSLENVGDAVALEVRVELEEGIIAPEQPYTQPRVKPGEAMPVLAIRTMQGGNHMYVTWRSDGTDETESQTLRLY